MDVEICESCQGIGEVREHVAHNYFFNKCESCNGTGRVLTRTYSYTVPFDRDKKEIYIIDSEIVSLIRKIEKK